MTDWLVVASKPKAEDVAVANLEEQGFVTYLPKMLVERRHARKVTKLEVPLFPGYLFVEYTDAWAPIVNTRGVHGVLTNSGTACRIAGRFVDEVRKTEREEMDRKRYRSRDARHPWNAGDPVEIIDGPFSWLPAVFLKGDRDRVHVLLNLFGRDTSAVLPISAVR